MTTDALLATVLDRLLPPTPSLAGAGGLGLAEGLGNDPLLASMPDAIVRVLAALPDDFTNHEHDAQVAALKAVEDSDPDAFAILINVVYNAYYVDPRVLGHLAGQTAYNPGAPQPAGYDIEPFDESILNTIRGRKPFWRKVGQ
jgi:hypothetical protein